MVGRRAGALGYNLKIGLVISFVLVNKLRRDLAMVLFCSRLSLHRTKEGCPLKEVVAKSFIVSVFLCMIPKALLGNSTTTLANSLHFYLETGEVALTMTLPSLVI